MYRIAPPYGGGRSADDTFPKHALADGEAVGRAAAAAVQLHRVCFNALVGLEVSANASVNPPARFRA
jgi:hypothetical protein